MSALPHPLPIPQTPAEIEQLRAHQQLAAAAHQVVQALLPEAAGAVERATSDVTEQLSALSELLITQQAHVEQTMTQVAQGRVSAEDSEAIRAEMAALHARMQQTVTRMIVGLQFQDRNTQLMQSAVHILRESTPPVSDSPSHPSMVVRLHSIARARNMIARISISEVRQMTIETLENFHILPRKSKLPEGDVAEDTIELF